MSYEPADALLQNRVILITGAGDGIGRALARRCAALGATVVLAGRTLRKLEAVYDRIEQAGGPQPAIYPINLEGAFPKDYMDLGEVLQREFGRLDGLVHNAAVLGGLTPIANYSVETWHRSLHVNLNAPFMLTQALLGLLNLSADASVIFTTDRVAEEGRAYWGAYAVAKGATQSLMKVLANELEANTPIRVNSVYPGKVRTRLRLDAYPAADQSDWTEPETVLAPYLYLLGPDSRGVTGRTLESADFVPPGGTV